VLERAEGEAAGGAGAEAVAAALTEEVKAMAPRAMVAMAVVNFIMDAFDL